MHAQQTRARGVCVSLATTTTTMHHVMPLCAPLPLAKGHCVAAAPAEWPGETAADQQSPGRTPATPDWHTLSTPWYLRTGEALGGAGGVTGGGWGVWRKSTGGFTVCQFMGQLKRNQSTINSRFSLNFSFLFQEPIVSEILGALGSKAGCKWGEVRNQQARGSEGGEGGVACLRSPPFWLLGGYRCAAPALLQTHSALSASSSERCNSK